MDAPNENSDTTDSGTDNSRRPSFGRFGCRTQSRPLVTAASNEELELISSYKRRILSRIHGFVRSWYPDVSQGSQGSNTVVPTSFRPRAESNSNQRVTPTRPVVNGGLRRQSTGVTDATITYNTDAAWQLPAPAGDTLADSGMFRSDVFNRSDNTNSVAMPSLRPSPWVPTKLLPLMVHPSTTQYSNGRPPSTAPTVVPNTSSPSAPPTATSRVSIRDYAPRPDPLHPHHSNQCGWLCLRPRCLQYALTSRWLLFWLCWAAAVQGMVVNGFVNVCITTIEKRYDLTSTDTGFMATSYDIASVICSVPVAYFGSRKGASKARWLGMGMLFMSLGSFVFALPHFITPQYSAAVQDSSSDINKSVITCSPEPSVQPCCDSSHEGGMLTQFRHVFTLGQFLHGVGATPLYTLGVTFLDESVPVRMSSLYLGVYYAMAVIGPAIGYVMGGQFLKIFINAPYEDPADFGLDPSSDRWLGGWWMGFIVSGCASLFVAWPLMAFPASLPRHKDEDDSSTPKSSNTRGAVSAASAGADAFQHLTDFPSETRSLISNITFVSLSLAGATEGILLTGFATFMPKFIESQFRVAASFSALVLGFIAVPAGGGGTMLGGWLIKKYDLSCSGILKVLLIGSLFCLLSCLSLLLYCPSQEFAGVDIAYDGTPLVSLEPNFNATCNMKCACNEVAFSPVCGANNVLYYSPCHAGCSERQQINKTELYTSCSCISQYANSQELQSTLSHIVTEDVMQQLSSYDVVVRDKCYTSCAVMPYFIFLCFVMMLLTFTISLPALSGTLRCVLEDQRSLALGLQWIIVRLLGTIPGPIIFGSVIDHSCRLWQKSCEHDGSCLSYNNFSMSRYILGISIGAKACSTVAFSIALWFYKPPSRRPQITHLNTIEDSSPTSSSTTTSSSLGSSTIPKELSSSQMPLAYDNPSIEVT